MPVTHVPYREALFGKHSASCAVVKLGGGLITFSDSGHPMTNRVRIIACAEELAATGRPTVLIHGTGAYGKPPAVRYGYLDGRLSRERGDVVARVSADLASLELDVLECLQAGGLRAFRMSTNALFHGRDGHVASRNVDLISELLAQGVTPVISGNFIVDTTGFMVCSSDVIAADLAVALQASTLVLATNAHGVYRDYGSSEAIYEALSLDDYEQLAALDSAIHDVSGGMKSKVVAGFRAAKHGIPTFVIDGRSPGNIAGVLDGRTTVGTQLICNASAFAD